MLEAEFNTGYEEIEDEKKRLKEVLEGYAGVVDEYVRCMGCTSTKTLLCEKLRDYVVKWKRCLSWGRRGKREFNL